MTNCIHNSLNLFGVFEAVGLGTAADINRKGAGFGNGVVDVADIKPPCQEKRFRDIPY